MANITNNKEMAEVAADVMNKVSETAKSVVDKAVSVGKDIYSHIGKTNADTRASESKGETQEIEVTMAGPVVIVKGRRNKHKEINYK